MKNSAAGEMNTQVEGGEEYKLLSSLKLSLDFKCQRNINVIIPRSHSFRNRNQNRWKNTVLGVTYQEAKWMCVISTHSHGEGPALHLLSKVYCAETFTAKVPVSHNDL